MERRSSSSKTRMRNTLLHLKQTSRAQLRAQDTDTEQGTRFRGLSVTFSQPPIFARTEDSGQPPHVHCAVHVTESAPTGTDSRCTSDTHSTFLGLSHCMSSCATFMTIRTISVQQHVSCALPQTCRQIASTFACVTRIALAFAFSFASDGIPRNHGHCVNLQQRTPFLGQQARCH